MRRETETAPVADPAADTLTEEEIWLRCVSCGHRVAREAARIAVNGAQVHDFMNPSGLRFRIACFAEAPGCAPHGERSTVWTWFPGFAWRVELCRGCGEHLGWSFHAATSFYGLVLDRLA
jgi:hypothetical protein